MSKVDKHLKEIKHILPKYIWKDAQAHLQLRKYKIKQ